MLNSDIRVDLHIHSKASGYKEGPDSAGSNIVAESDIEHLDVLFEKLSEAQNGINMISITDHNRFDPDLYEAINVCITNRDSGTVEAILAGVEFDVLFQKDKPHAHVIAIFDVGDWSKNPDVCKKNYKAIRDGIEKDKLTGADDKYTLDRFESILNSLLDRRRHADGGLTERWEKNPKRQYLGDEGRGFSVTPSRSAKSTRQSSESIGQGSCAYLWS